VFELVVTLPYASCIREMEIAMSNNINLFADMFGINIKKKTKKIRNHNKLYYEWKIETTHKDTDDIQEVDHSDDLPYLLYYKNNKPDTKNYHHVLVLTRYKCNDFDGVNDQSYAYPENNKMPTEFDDGIKVPKRFLVEYEKVWK